MKRIIPAIFLVLVQLPLLAASPVTDVDTIRSQAREQKEGLKTTVLELDRNGDGVVDQVIILNEKGAKIYEELDYNFDGKMDDFCFYSDGVLVREEIDTNFDGQIDTWVYIKKGIYIERYEQDTNHDGIIDRIKTFGPDQ